MEVVNAAQVRAVVTVALHHAAAELGGYEVHNEHTHGAGRGQSMVVVSSLCDGSRPVPSSVIEVKVGLAESERAAAELLQRHEEARSGQVVAHAAALADRNADVRAFVVTVALGLHHPYDIDRLCFVDEADWKQKLPAHAVESGNLHE